MNRIMKLGLVVMVLGLCAQHANAITLVNNTKKAFDSAGIGTVKFGAVTPGARIARQLNQPIKANFSLSYSAASHYGPGEVGIPRADYWIFNGVEVSDNSTLTITTAPSGLHVTVEEPARVYEARQMTAM